MNILNLIMYFSSAALASGGEHGVEGAVTIPTQTVFYQALNLGILLIGGIYYFRNSIKNIFIQRQAVFLESAKKSQQAREAAEKSFEEIKGKIHELSLTHETSLQNAHNHAKDVKKQIEDETRDMMKRIKEDAELAVRMEVTRAKAELREQLLKDAFSHTEKKLQTEVSGEDQKRLQSSFSKHLEGLRP